MENKAAFRIFLLGLVGMILATAPVHSCPMCLNGRSLEISAQPLVYSESSVLALPSRTGESFRVVETIKGNTFPGSIIEGKVLKAEPSNVRLGSKPLLLVRENSESSWVNFGEVEADQATVLRRFAATKRSTSLSEEEWVAQVTLFLPYLASPSPMISEIAAAELSSAPASALRSLKPHLDAADLRQSLADPARSKWQPLYGRLLAIAAAE